MAWLAAATPYISAAGTVLSVASNMEQAQQAKKSAAIEAQQLEDNANASNASAQRVAMEERRKARLASSRLQALAGGGNSDPTVIRLHEDIAGEGEYRAMSALYEGATQGVGYQNQANATRYNGNARAQAGYLNAASSALSDTSSLYKKYGGKH